MMDICGSKNGPIFDISFFSGRKVNVVSAFERSKLKIRSSFGKRRGKK